MTKFLKDFFKNSRKWVINFYFILLFSCFLSGSEWASAKSPLSSMDWHVGASFSPIYEGLNQGIWDTVPYLGFLQREDSAKQQSSNVLNGSFSAGGLAGVGRVVYNKNKIKMSVGAEYDLSYYQTQGTFTFGNLEGTWKPTVQDIRDMFPWMPASIASIIVGKTKPIAWDDEFMPPPGSGQQILMQGLDHRLVAYFKTSFGGEPFPLDLQLNGGLAFVHLLSLKLTDYDGSTATVSIFHPNKVKFVSGYAVSASGTSLDPQERSVPISFGLEDTFQMALTGGVRLSFSHFFVGADYMTNVIENSLRVQIGLMFKSMHNAENA